MIRPGARSNMYTIRPSASFLLHFPSELREQTQICVSQDAPSWSVTNRLKLSLVWAADNRVKREARRLGGLAVRGCERGSAAAGKIQMCQVDTRERGCYRKWRSWLYKANLSVWQRNSARLWKLLAESIKTVNILIISGFFSLNPNLTPPSASVKLNGRGSAGSLLWTVTPEAHARLRELDSRLEREQMGLCSAFFTASTHFKLYRTHLRRTFLLTNSPGVTTKAYPGGSAARWTGTGAVKTFKRHPTKHLPTEGIISSTYCRRAAASSYPNGEMLLPLTVFVTSVGVEAGKRVFLGEMRAAWRPFQQ